MVNASASDLAEECAKYDNTPQWIASSPGHICFGIELLTQRLMLSGIALKTKQTNKPKKNYAWTRFILFTQSKALKENRVC